MSSRHEADHDMPGSSYAGVGGAGLGRGSGACPTAGHVVVALSGHGPGALSQPLHGPCEWGVSYNRTRCSGVL